jgi:hypothetical protein
MTSQSSPEADDAASVRGVGAFVILWSVFEAVLEIGIMRELKLSPVKSAIVTCEMGTKARSGCLRSLISLDRPKHEALGLILRIINEGERNTIHHGMIQVRPAPIKFIKRTAGGSYKETITSFSSQKMQSHINKLSGLINSLQSSLGITDNDLNTFLEESRPTSNSSMSPKPPSSKR